MQRIDSWQQYLDLKAEAKARGLTLSNLYFLPGQARQKIDAGRLYCRRDPAGAGWLLLDESGGFYRCYYQLAPQTPCAPVQLDRDAVIELPFRAGSGPALQPELEQIARMGFALGRESARMERPAAGLPDSPPDPPGVSVGPAQPDRQAEIAALLDASFDRLYSFLPGGAELAGRIAAGQVLAAVGQDGRLLGVLNSSCGHNTASIDQLAVQPDARGRRVGAALAAAYHRLYAGRVRSFGHWVDLHNAPALALYRRFGYQLTPKRANEYVLRLPATPSSPGAHAPAET